MKADFTQALAARDASALARIAGKYPDSSKPPAGVVGENDERLVDALFRQLKQLFPAASATNLRTEADESAAKKQWIVAFAENGIRTREQLSDGMRIARSNQSPFWPSPGQFIAWCNEGSLQRAGLPTPAGLVDMVKRYCSRRGFYADATAYPWEHPAHYWMVTHLYSQMRLQGWTESELVEHAKAELQKMARRISSGETIPEPVQMIAQPEPRPVSRERGLEIIARIRREVLNKPRKKLD